MKERDLFERFAVTAGLALITFQVSKLAFSWESAKEIKETAGWCCEECGRSRDDGWMIHASHENHDRDNPDYDEPYNGTARCVEHHLQQHIDAVGNSWETLGLREHHNQMAIELLSETEWRTDEYLTMQAAHKKYSQRTLEEWNADLFG